MSVYALIDPRTKATRYVGRSGRPTVRLRAHLRGAHSVALRGWIADLRASGLVPELRLLDGATEREWIVRLSPDLNVLAGKNDCGPAPTDIAVSIRFPGDVYADASAAALADDRSLNSLVVRAVRTYLEKEKTGRK